MIYIITFMDGKSFERDATSDIIALRKLIIDKPELAFKDLLKITLKEGERS